MRLQPNLLRILRDATRDLRPAGLLSLFLIASFSRGQTVSIADPQLETIHAQARYAMLGASRPNSLVLDGTFTSSEGSLNQNGSAHLTVGSDGSYSIRLSRTTGAIDELRTVSEGRPACTWTDQDSVIHQSQFLNCLPPAWFFPHLSLLSGTSDATLPAWRPSAYSTDSAGSHLKFQFMSPTTDGNQKDPQLLKPFDLVLATDTHLPMYALFTVHPDNPWVHADIPVKIAYSDYRSVAGVMIPFHIQRFVNGSLVVDLAITSASIQ